MIALLLLLACGSSIDCSNETNLIASKGDQMLACREGGVAVKYIQVLSGRPVPPVERKAVYDGLQSLFLADPAKTRALLTTLHAEGEKLVGSGQEIAAVRSEMLYQAHKGDGPIGKEHVLFKPLSRQMSVWASDDDNRQVLTEADVEGFLLYASLCREVQGAEPLRISLADRVPMYRKVAKRFSSSSKEEQLALQAFGPFWKAITYRWRTADYEEQQSWIMRAPLPGPMKANSPDYATEILKIDLHEAATVLHERLGPFELQGASSFKP